MSYSERWGGVIKVDKENHNYKIFRNRATKFKDRVYFKRINLRKDDFKEVNNGYDLEENLDYNGIKILFRIHLDSSNIFDLFSTPHNNNFSIAGDIKGFSILITTENLVTKSSTVCINSGGRYGKVSYSFSLIGLTKKFQSIGGLKHKSSKRKRVAKKECSSIVILSQNSRKGVSRTSVPNHISWAVSHPFQGGRVSPR